MEKQKIYEIFGKNIKEIRLNKSISIEKLAKLTNISRAYLQKIESGKARKITFTQISKLNIALNTTTYDMLKGIN